MADYTLGDIRAALTGANWGCGYGGNMFGCGNNELFLFAILFLFNGGFGGMNNRSNVATTEDLANGFNFNSLQEKGNETLAAIQNFNQNLSNAVCQLGYNQLEQSKSLSQQLSECCCGIKELVTGVNYTVAQKASDIERNMASYFAAMNQSFNNGVQSVKDMFRDYQESNLREENMKNYISSQLCGVLRWPNSASYSVNCNPFNFGQNPCCG